MKNKNLLMGCIAAIMAVCVGVAGASSTAYRLLPADQRGNPLAQYSHASYKYIVGTTETVVCSGVCVLLAVIRSTGAVNDAVQIRGTAAADGLNVNTVFSTHFTADTGAHDNPVAFPILVSSNSSSGITAKINGAATEQVTVVYIDLDN